MNMEKIETGDYETKRFGALINASYIAIGSDIFLILLKIGLAVLTGSIIFKADAYHSGGDLAVSLTVLFSILVKYKFSTKSFAREAEAIVSLLISILLIFGGLKILYDAIYTEADAFLIKQDVSLVLAFIGISIACMIALLIAGFKSKIGKKHNSLAFTAEGVHTFSDFISSFGVWFTLLFGYFGIHIERIMTFIIGLVIFQIGIRLGFKVLKIAGFSSKFVSKIKNKPILQFALFTRLKTKIKLFKVFSLNEAFFTKHIKKFLSLTIILILLMYFGLGFYTILPYQTGVEMLYGRVKELNSPGLHYHLPEPFGKVLKVDTGIAARIESGFRTNWSDDIEEPEAYLWEFSHTDGRFIKVIDESLAITGDENIIDANFLCYYRITDPVIYAIQSKNAREILRTVLNREINSVLAKYRIDALLTVQRGDIQNELKIRMKEKVKMLKIGVDIDKVFMQEVHPPIDVVPDYRAVASAREKKNEIIHKANGYANDLIPRSRGKGKKSILEAETYKIDKLSFAFGEAKSFLLKEKIFNASSKLQKIRLRWDMIESLLFGKIIYVLPNDSKRRYYLSDKSSVKEVETLNIKKDEINEED